MVPDDKHRDVGGFSNGQDGEDNIATSENDASRRFRLLLDFSAILNSEIDDIELVYKEALRYLGYEVEFETATVQLLDAGMIRVVASTGFKERDLVNNLEFPLDRKFPNYRVVESQKPLMLPDIRAAYPHFKTASGHYISGHIRSWLGVPLITRDEVVGMIALDRTEVKPFTDMEINLVSGFAAHVAAAIRNARLYHELDQANRTKETILRELHHRVKNNMQLISSILSLRSEGLQGDETRQVLKDLQLKVLVLAEVHERLYQSATFGEVDLREYTEGIVHSVVNGYSKHPSAVDLQMDLESVQVGLDMAVPHGLIVSELVLNAVKHGVGGDGTMQLLVQLKLDQGLVRTVVSDNGPGVQQPFELHKTSSFGTTMIVSLVQQLNGTVTVESDKGMTWEVEYPLGSRGTFRRMA